MMKISTFIVIGFLFSGLGFGCGVEGIDKSVYGVPAPEPFSLISIGDYRYVFQVNVGDYSNINIDDVYLVGWNDDWENMIKMSPISDSWVEVVLITDREGIQGFNVTNKALTEWLWLDQIDDSLVVPSDWVYEDSNPNDLLLGLWIDSPDSFQYLEGSL